MGQATLDLPDPLVESAAAGPSPNADDLLAQLAGDEIDRMLAEAEVERPDAAASPADPLADPETQELLSKIEVAETFPSEPESPKAEEPPVVEFSAKQQLESEPAPIQPVADVALQTEPTTVAIDSPQEEATAPLEDPLPAGSTEAPAAALTEVSEPDKAVAAQLDALFTELSTTPQTPVQETVEPAKDSDSLVGPAIGGDIATPVVADKAAADPSQQTGDLERQVLSADAMAAVGAAITVTEAEKEKLPQKPVNTTPLYVRPLIWINAPLAHISDDARDILGKIAITTIINAMALLIYVFLFR